MRCQPNGDFTGSETLPTSRANAAFSNSGTIIPRMKMPREPFWNLLGSSLYCCAFASNVILPASISALLPFVLWSQRDSLLPGGLRDQLLLNHPIDKLRKNWRLVLEKPLGNLRARDGNRLPSVLRHLLNDKDADGSRRLPGPGECHELRPRDGH